MSDANISAASQFRKGKSKVKLKSVEIQGFKSFPDKTKLTFEKDITAVIGPNGNGKSNISDSIRWVLGEQSSKTLRGQKMEDVIFNGTVRRRPLGFAEVSLTLDNSDRTLNFDNDEVTVTRRYYRSGESEYKLNGASVRLKDIHELFMDTGLGRDGYSMIGQGRIDEIVGAKSNDRREIFEEAAGISKYRYRKQEAERKLAHAEENLVRLRDIFAELEGRVGPLEEQSRKAQAFLDLSEQKRSLEIGLWLNTVEHSKTQLREQDYKITLARSQYDGITNELANIEAGSEISMQDSRQITARIDEIRREQTKAEEESSRIKGDIAVLQNTAQMNLQTKQMLAADIDRAAEDDDKTTERIAECEQQIALLSDNKEELVKQQSEISSQMNLLADDSGGKTEQIEQKNRELSRIALDISNSRVALAKAQTAADELRTRSLEADETIQKLNAAVSEYESELSQLKDDMKSVDEKISESSNVASGNELMLRSRNKKLEDLRSGLSELQGKVSEYERRAQILSDLEKNMDGFSGAVKAVTNEAKRGTLRGVHGLVSRLIKVDDKYGVAIETALGAAMQNIVVEDENSAKRAMEMLKRNKAGRATFLPLTSVKANRLREDASGESGYVGRADELVEFDKKYTDIIGWLLGRTVICEDIDYAVAMARKFSYHFRIVTLDGQVVNAGGSLTGGSHVRGAGLLGRAAEIERLHEKARQTKSQYDEQNEKFKSLEAEVLKFEAQITAAKDEINIAMQDKARLESELRLVGEQKDAALRNIKELSDLKTDFEKRGSSTDSEASDALRIISESETLKSRLEREIELLSGGRDELQARRDELAATHSQLGMKILETEKNIDVQRSVIEQCKLNISDRVSRVESLKAQIGSLENENEEISHKIEQHKILISGFSAKFEDSDRQIADLEERRDELEQKTYALRAREKELSGQKEYAASELARLSAKKETLQREYDNVIAKLFDEYELSVDQAIELGIEIEDEKAAASQLNSLRAKIRALGTVNLAAIEEFKEVNERYLFMKEQIDDVETSKQQLSKLINGLTTQMKEMFREKFAIISSNFAEVFREMFGGGTASLELRDPEDILNSDIDINVQPPGKSISILEQLSGGEKALVAVSIYFAIMKVNAPPFCLLDEVEAALDDVNVDRFAKYLRRMSGNTQFIVITHRRGTMEEADVLYGVTMQEAGVSKLLSIDVSQIEKTLEGKAK